MRILRETNTSILAAIILISGLFLLRCARPGTPTGGPKDEDPPVVVLEIPANRTVYFNFDKVTITFNEFISLKDASKEIFISPPVRTRPEFKTAGKKVIVEFQEELKDNSTYTINFGNSIVDFTEGNPLVNYEYVFSTGGHIDSLSIPGKVLNSFDLKPEAGIIVMVYQDNNDTIPLDSLPLMVPPKSASKSTKEGDFRINNLAAGSYKLFALEDANNNYIFDLPNERIAFLDSLVSIEPEPQPELELEPELLPDSIPVGATDTARIPIPSIQVLSENSYTLYLFTESNPVQKLLSKKLVGQYLLQYIFQLPVDSVTIQPVGFDTGQPGWYLTEYRVLRDTVNFWLKPGLPDTIRVFVRAGDSIADTSRYVLSRSTQDTKTKRKEASTGGSLRINSNTMASAFDLNKKLLLSFALPVEDYDPARIHLFTLTDTLIPKFSFYDTLQRIGEIDYQWLPGEFYHLLIEDSVFCDLSGAYNDSTSFKFKVRNMEDYGILFLNLLVPEVPGQYIIQLMTDKEDIIRQKIVSTSGIVRFDYLMAGNYKLKMIYDINSNGVWDTGDYNENKLPERVEYYAPALVIRSNWDLQEEWKLE